MSFSAHYLKKHNFLLNNMAGKLNNANLISHVSELNVVTQNMTDLKELADCRGVTAVEKLSTEGIVNTAGSEVLKPNSLLAILIAESELFYGMARAYQTFTDETRKETKIFHSLNEALKWLAKDKEEQRIFSNFISSIDEDSFKNPTSIFTTY